jgi:hypothetical protein
MGRVPGSRINRDDTDRLFESTIDIVLKQWNLFPFFGISSFPNSLSVFTVHVSLRLGTFHIVLTKQCRYSFQIKCP